MLRTLADAIGLKFENFALKVNEPKTVTLGTGLLVVIAPGSQYSNIYHIDYWSSEIKTLSNTFNGIIISKEVQTKNITITNNLNTDFTCKYVFIG